MAEDRLDSLPIINNSVSSIRTKSLSLTAWFICSLGALFYCYEYFLRISPSVMTRELMQVYHLNATQIGVFSAYYYHAYVPMQVIVGLLMDRYGPRFLLTMACSFCVLGTFLFAANYSLSVAQAGRFLVGFGSAFAFVGALKLATIWLPPNRLAMVSGIITCLGMIGGMAGDIVLRVLVDSMGWQITIYGSAMAGIVLALIIWAVVRDVSPRNSSLSSGLNFHSLIIGLWGVIKNPQMWLNGMIGLLLFLSLSAFAELWGIQYLEHAHGFSKTHAAYANSLIFLGWAVGGPLWGWLSDVLKRRCMPILVGAMTALVLICILLYVPHLSLYPIYFLLFAFGVATSVQVLVFAIACENANIKISATAIALTNTFVMLGGNVFQPLVGKLLDLKWTGHIVDGVRVYSPEAYQFALTALPIGMVLVMVITFFIRETHARAAE